MYMPSASMGEYDSLSGSSGKRSPAVSGRAASQASLGSLTKGASQASLGRGTSQSYLRNYSPLPVEEPRSSGRHAREQHGHSFSSDCCPSHGPEGEGGVAGPGGPLWNSLLSRQDSRGVRRQDSKGALARQESRGSNMGRGLERNESRSSGLGRNDSSSSVLARTDSRSSALGRTNSRTSGLGRTDSRGDGLRRQESRGSDLGRMSSRNSTLYEKTSLDRGQKCSVHDDEGEEVVEWTGAAGGALWNSLQPTKSKTLPRQPSRSGNLARQDSRTGTLGRQDSRSLGKQDSRNGGLRKQDSRNMVLTRDSSRGGLFSEDCSVHQHGEVEEEWNGAPGGPLWNALQPTRQDSRSGGLGRQDSKNGGLRKQDSRNGALGRQGSLSGGLGRQDSRSGGLSRQSSKPVGLGRQDSRGMMGQDSRGAQKYSKTSLGGSCSVHPEGGEEPPFEQQAMGGALWNSVQATRSLPRQESRKSLQRQESRSHVTEPYTDKTNWKDSLRGAGSRKPRADEGSRRRSAPRQESPRRCSSGATSPDRSFPTESPPRVFPRAARSGSSPPPSPAPSRSPSPPRPHLTIPQGLDGGSPLGDYVPFDKFRASRGQEPDTRSDPAAKLSSSPWSAKAPAATRPAASSLWSAKAATSSRPGTASSGKASDSEDWGLGSWSSGAADSSYGSWAGGSPPRESSTSPKSSVAGLGLAALKKPVSGSWSSRRD